MGPKKKDVGGGGRATCKGCGTKYSYITVQAPASCGRVQCRFEYGPWGTGKRVRNAGATPLEWESRARMAMVRQECGVALNDIDRKALEKFPQPRSLMKMAVDMA